MGDGDPSQLAIQYGKLEEFLLAVRLVIAHLLSYLKTMTVHFWLRCLNWSERLNLPLSADCGRPDNENVLEN